MKARGTREISEPERRRAMALSRVDALVYALMVGLGEVYFVADAVRLGATAPEIALLVGLPLAVGAAGPILALRLLALLGRRRPVVIGSAAFQAAMLLLAGWLDGVGAMTVEGLIAVSTAYQVFAQAAGTAWSSWFGDLVPSAERGRYFATRNRGAYAGTLIGIVGGGLVLSGLEPAPAGLARAGGGEGFALVYLLAGLCRLVSVALLVASREGRFSGVPDPGRVLRFLRTGRGSGAWRLVLLVGLLHVAVYVAGPFFNPYMLQDLEFTYLEYLVASAALVSIKVVVLPLWGRSIDRNGARRTFVRGTVLLSLVPLPWVVSTDLWPILACQLLSGFAWSGFEVGHFSLLLELGYRRMRPTIFAAQSVVTGSAQLVGGLLGSAFLASVSDTRYVFALSGGLRLLVAVLILRLVPEGTGALRRLRPALRVSGFRAGTGMATRPIETGEVDPDPTEPVAESASS